MFEVRYFYESLILTCWNLSLILLFLGPVVTPFAAMFVLVRYFKKKKGACAKAENLKKILFTPLWHTQKPQ